MPSRTDKTETAPSPTDELVAVARALAPAIASRVAAANEHRDTPAETISALREAGLFRVFQPARWGGLEGDPRSFYAIQNAIAEACPSTAWVYGVLSVQSFVLARFDARAQEDVWGADPLALACSSFAPVGTATPVDGGYRLGGRWSFGSGSSHAQWALLGARVSGATTVGGRPDTAIFLLPRKDYELLDVWHTFGLRGTGSNDIRAQDVFVPSHRLLRLDPGVQTISGRDLPGPALYRLPWLYLFSSSISNFAIGAARGALKAFCTATRDRVSPMTGIVAQENPALQQAVARLHAELDTTEAMYARHIERLQDHVISDVPLPMADGLLLRTQLTSALRRITAALDELLLLQGARAVSLESPLTRVWLDLSAARAHIGNDPATAATMLGATLLQSV